MNKYVVYYRNPVCNKHKSFKAEDSAIAFAREKQSEGFAVSVKYGDEVVDWN